MKPLTNWGKHRLFGHSGRNATEKRDGCYNAEGFSMPNVLDLLSVNTQRPMQSNFGVGRVA